MTTKDLMQLRTLLKELVNSKDYINSNYDRGASIDFTTISSANNILNDLDELIYGYEDE